MSCVTATNTLYKQPFDKRQYSMDFSNLMSTGETIEESSPAPVVSSEKMNGDATDLTIDTVAVSGQTVTFWVDAGTNHQRYRVEVQIETSGGQKLEGDGILVVTDK